MGIFGNLFTREVKETKPALFEEVFGVASDRVTIDDALEIPIVNACVSRVSDVIASTDLKLYKKTDKGREEVENDSRVKLLNTRVDNGSINSFELKKLMVRDYFLKGHCYFYIKRKGNTVEDIAYLENVAINHNHDPFNKVYTILAYDRTLRPYETLRITRNSKNGIKGKSIIEETGLHFLLIIKTMERLLMDAKRGFLPKGMFKMEKNIKDLDRIRDDIKRMLNDNNSGYIFMNSAIQYEPLEKKKDVENEAKANTSELNKIAAMFGVPVSIINGGANEEDKFNFINFTILPLLANIESSLNRDLLTEREQGKYYFAFDTKELLKGNLKERFEAYQLAIKNNIMSMDEVRDLENMPRLNFGFYKFNIADAMYYRDDDNDTNMLVNVNTNTAIDLNQVLNTKSENGVMDFNPNHSKSVLNDKNFGQADKVAIGQEDTQEEVSDEKESETRPEQDDKRLNKKGKEEK
ncbi:phage portal protein [Gemella haemolysans]|uniref:phage portal protein n=1 Tax=Gemella haemolysans TaxID=1379 RepID=UPI00232BA5CE|nr:phage portal protein [Gemella haemolysans]MDB6212432.1 phage portal protein [Gemella haemolysans]